MLKNCFVLLLLLSILQWTHSVKATSEIIVAPGDSAAQQATQQNSFVTLLTPLPVTVNVISALSAYSPKKDFPIEVVEGGYKFLKTSKSFRASLVQVANDAWTAMFNSHQCMSSIENAVKDVPVTVQQIRNILDANIGLKDRQKGIAIPFKHLKKMSDKTKEYATNAAKEAANFHGLLKELISGLALTQSKFEKDKDVEAANELKRLEQEKKDLAAFKQKEADRKAEQKRQKDLFDQEMERANAEVKRLEEIRRTQELMLENNRLSSEHIFRMMDRIPFYIRTLLREHVGDAFHNALDLMFDCASHSLKLLYSPRFDSRLFFYLPISEELRLAMTYASIPLGRRKRQTSNSGEIQAKELVHVSNTMVRFLTNAKALAQSLSSYDGKSSLAGLVQLHTVTYNFFFEFVKDGKSQHAEVARLLLNTTLQKLSLISQCSSASNCQQAKIKSIAEELMSIQKIRTSFIIGTGMATEGQAFREYESVPKLPSLRTLAAQRSLLEPTDDDFALYRNYIKHRLIEQAEVRYNASYLNVIEQVRRVLKPKSKRDSIAKDSYSAILKVASEGAILLNKLKTQWETFSQFLGIISRSAETLTDDKFLKFEESVNSISTDVLMDAYLRKNLDSTLYDIIAEAGNIFVIASTYNVVAAKFALPRLSSLQAIPTNLEGKQFQAHLDQISENCTTATKDILKYAGTLRDKVNGQLEVVKRTLRRETNGFQRLGSDITNDIDSKVPLPPNSAVDSL